MVVIELFYCDACGREMVSMSLFEIVDKTKQPDMVYYFLCKSCYKEFKEMMKHASN